MRRNRYTLFAGALGMGGLGLAVGCSSNATSATSASDRIGQVGSAATTAPAFTPTLGPADVLSPTSTWYKNVSSDAVASNSASMIAAMSFGFGSPQVDFSITVMQVSAGTPTTTVQFNPSYTPDSDSTPVPVPVGGALEGETGYTCTQGGDCHLLIIDPAARQLFELYSVNNTSANGTGTWTAADETVWLMDGVYTPAGRGYGCTSADAAGFSVIAGLIGVREANAGQINHALRFILPNSSIRKGLAYTTPATHGTSATSSTAGVPYGARLRLKASFDASQVTSIGGKAVVAALQKYGMFLADGGNDAFTAEADGFYAAEGLSWNGVLSGTDLESITPSDFDVVDYEESALMSGDDCVRAPEPPTVPRIDAGAPPAPAPDAGSTEPPPDAGAPAHDAGTPAHDAGAPAHDAGSPVVDAGSGLGPNLFPDPGFETSVDGALIWPAGTPPTLTTDAIAGKSSLEAVLPSSDAVLWLEEYVNGKTGAVHASTEIRNDGSSSVTIQVCVGIYDQNWNTEASCTSVVLAPGVVTSVALEHVLGAGTTANAANLYFESENGAATFALDDAYVGFAAE